MCFPREWLGKHLGSTARSNQRSNRRKSANNWPTPARISRLSWVCSRQGSKGPTRAAEVRLPRSQMTGVPSYSSHRQTHVSGNANTHLDFRGHCPDDLNCFGVRVITMTRMHRARHAKRRQHETAAKRNQSSDLPTAGCARRSDHPTP